MTAENDETAEPAASGPGESHSGSKLADEGRYTLGRAWKRWRASPPNLEAFRTDDISLTGRPEATIERMRETADRYLLQEHERMASLQTRGGQLAGFSGLILGLLPPLAAEGVAGLSGAACSVARSLLVIGTACVLISAVICLFAVVRPSRLRGITGSEETGDWFKNPSLLDSKPWQLEGRTLRFYPAALAWQEWVNGRKAAALFIASVFLAIGLTASAVADHSSESRGQVNVRERRPPNTAQHALVFQPARLTEDRFFARLR